MELRRLSTVVKNLYSAGSRLPVGPLGMCVVEEETSSVPNVEKDPVLAGAATQDLWGAILERVKSQVNPESYATWFEPTRLAAVSEGELLVEGPNQFFVDWLAEHHLDKL